MYIPDKAEFRPSNETLNKWLATRKPDLMVGGATQPGFFSDTGNASDSWWLFLGCIGELVGFLTTVYAGLIFGGVYLLLAALGIFLFIICDFVFARWLHRNKALECRLRSEKNVTENTKHAVGLQNRLDEGKFVDFLLRTGIITIALVKTAGIIVLGVFGNLFLYIPFLIIYLIVAYVHLNHTGYYFAYWSTERSIQKEHRRYGSDGFDAREVREPLKTLVPLRDPPLKHNPHVIEMNGTANEYMIKAKGVLTDDDILNLIAGQDPENKQSVFRACRRLQLENTPAPEGRQSK